jgi:hypothetical protein
MKTTLNVSMVAAILFFSFIGGGVSHWLFSRRPAEVQPAADQPNVLKAERLELVDSGGQTRAMLAVTQTGSSLTLCTAEGQTRVELGTSTGSDAGLILRDPDGIRRTSLTVGRAGPALALFDVDQQLRAYLALISQPHLGFYDANGELRADIAVIDGIPSIVMFGPQDNLIWEAP